MSFVPDIQKYIIMSIEDLLFSFTMVFVSLLDNIYIPDNHSTQIYLNRQR